MTGTSLSRSVTPGSDGVHKLVLRSPHDFVTNLGALVGYTPTESVVAVFIRDDIVQVTLCCTLPDQLADLHEYLHTVVSQTNANSLLIAVCTPRGDGPLPHAAAPAAQHRAPRGIP